MAERWGISIPMRDGVQLAADLFLPAATEDGMPTIVVRTPYGRQSHALIQQARFFASHGYAVLNVDVRGRGDSEGVFTPYRNEGRDGYDTVEWAAAQPYASGRVGTLGGSYLAKSQWLCALEHPPHLQAMVTLVSPSDAFVEWPTGTPVPSHLCWLFLVSGRTVQNTHALDWENIYWHLPLYTMDEAAGRVIPQWREEFTHPTLDAWWQEISYQQRFGEIDLPVLHVSGWYDDEQVGTLRNFVGMTTHAPSARARAAQRLVMGPWPHQVNESTRIGDVDFGPEAVIDLSGLELRFFDRWLKGIDNGVDREPPVRYFLMGKNEWRDASAWPPPDTAYVPWYFHSRGSANGSIGDGTLSTRKPSVEEPADRYKYNPLNPVPFLTQPTSEQIGGPDDYREVHLREDVLVYTSDPVHEELEVTGPVCVELYAATSAPDTDFMAQLHDVWPNGYVQRLCDGMVRVRYRHGMDKAVFTQPGEVMRLAIDCWNTSHVFLPGHRIRVHVTSSAFPKYDRNPNTEDALGLSERLECAEQTVYHDALRPSAVILPVIKR
ncbi:CocE/NonD family hydrolase [Alicyclobacillus kakegawensis]|uniref:CocE/NonD family hydrolase n=1 Tax=Alicyclobacillus kakegawensis TaxID=392012 RepID=UPI00082B9879|nr:CocE/NonD family hydrolase [Alicyclobacillus kakegawensis]